MLTPVPGGTVEEKAQDLQEQLERGENGEINRRQMRSGQPSSKRSKRGSRPKKMKVPVLELSENRRFSPGQLETSVRRVGAATSNTPSMIENFTIRVTTSAQDELRQQAREQCVCQF